MKYFKISLLLSLFFLTNSALAEEAWCLKSYSKHYQAAKKAVVASGVATGAAAISSAFIGPFALIPVAIAGGGIVTAKFYQHQYEKAYALIKESNPNWNESYKYVLRVAKSAGLSPGQTAQIVWKNESKFCTGKTPWIYRTIRRAIKKRKLTL